MSDAALPRRIATVLLRSAISIAPQEALEWGHAMLSELRHVEGNWPALFWSLGSAGVLAKHALVALIFPGRNRSTIPAGGDLFSKEGSMRKPALAVIASCVLASLLFFLAPVFRQAFHVSLAQWHNVFHIHSPLDESSHFDPTLTAIAQKAEAKHDAEALAFVAIQTRSQSESVRLADAAVQLDGNLTWVYGVVAAKWSFFPELDRWVPVLGKYDPQNALPYLIVAEKIDIDEALRKDVPRHVEDQLPAWKDAMAAAFNSPKLDTYYSRVADLEQRVLARYRVDDPFQVLRDRGWWYGLPSYTAQDTGRDASLLLKCGEAFEAEGDRNRAFDEYSRVAKFAQLIGTKHYFLPNEPLHDALTHLELLSRKEGNEAQADLYTSLISQAQEQRQEGLADLRVRVSDYVVPRWDATVARASGAALLLSAILLVTCLLAAIIRARSLRLAALRPSAMTLAIMSSSAVLAFLASAMLYVSYRPYSRIFQQYVRYGDESGLLQLNEFLGYAQAPLGTEAIRFLNLDEVVYRIWLGVVVLCALALVFGVQRYLQTRPRTAAA